MSFPVVAASVGLAEPLVETLYGAEYVGSASILAILSAGFFLSGVLGFAGLTLRAVGRVRFVVGVDILTAVAAVAAYLVLIPTLGVLGAAIGTAATLAVQAVAYHVGAQRTEGPDANWRPVAGLLGISGAACVALALVESSLKLGLWPGLVIVAVAWVALLWWQRDALDVGGIFPEIRRIPVVGGLFAGGSGRGTSRAEGSP